MWWPFPMETGARIYSRGAARARALPIEPSPISSHPEVNGEDISTPTRPDSLTGPPVVGIIVFCAFSQFLYLRQPVFDRRQLILEKTDFFVQGLV